MGGGHFTPGRLPPSPPPIDYVHRDEIWEICFQHSLEGIQKLPGGGTLYPGVDSTPPPPPTYRLCSYGWDRRNCFPHPLEGHSETSNDQVLLNPFDHHIKMKAFYPGVDSTTAPPPPPTLTMLIGTRYGKLFQASSWKGIQKLQMTRLFSFS